jgi:hypothetical protein
MRSLWAEWWVVAAMPCPWHHNQVNFLSSKDKDIWQIIKIMAGSMHQLKNSIFIIRVQQLSQCTHTKQHSLSVPSKLG